MRQPCEQAYELNQVNCFCFETEKISSAMFVYYLMSILLASTFNVAENCARQSNGFFLLLMNVSLCFALTHILSFSPFLQNSSFFTPATFLVSSLTFAFKALSQSSTFRQKNNISKCQALRCQTACKYTTDQVIKAQNIYRQQCFTILINSYFCVRYNLRAHK